VRLDRPQNVLFALFAESSQVAAQLADRKIVFAVANPTDALRRELDRFGVTARIGPDHIYDSIQGARDAFHRTRPGTA